MIIKQHYNNNSNNELSYMCRVEVLYSTSRGQQKVRCFVYWLQGPDVVLTLLVRSGPFPLSQRAPSPRLEEEDGLRCVSAMQLLSTAPLKVIICLQKVDQNPQNERKVD